MLKLKLISKKLRVAYWLLEAGKSRRNEDR
jgi:hypothetical protein